MNSKKTILIVEDDPMISVLEIKVITEAGFKAIAVGTGLDAIESIKNNPDISLIMMDINLGEGIDGTEAAVEILKIKEIPIIFLTSHSEKEMVDKVKGITRYGYVLKNSGEFVIIESINMAYELFEANQRLKDREEKYRTLVENQTEIICRFLPDGTILFANDVFCRIIGKSCDEIIGKQWQKIGFTDDILNIESKLETISRENPIAIIENQIIIASRKTRWFQFINQGIFDHNGKLIEIQTVGRDITEQKKIQEALKESEERFRRIFEEGQFGLAISNTNFKFIEANPAFCRMLGYTLNELKELTFKDITHPDNVNIDITNVDAIKRGEKSVYKTEKKYKKKNGDILWGNLMTSAIRDADNNVLYYIAMIEDITERKKIEEDLANTKAMLEAAFNQTNIPMVLVSVPDNIIRLANYASREFLGVLDEPDSLGKSLFEFVQTWQDFDKNGNPKKIEEMPLALAIQGIETKEVEYYIKRKDGTIRWELVSAFPIKNINGDIIAAYIVFPDITERKVMEESLRENVEKYKDLAEKSGVLICEIDSEGTFLYVNAAYKNVLGYNPEDLIGHKAFEIGHPSQHEVAKVRLESSLKEEKQQINEWQFKDKSGNWHWLKCFSNTYTNSNGMTRINVVSIDITDKKKAEQEVKNLLNQHDILLNEVHHRIKNDMRIISSMLAIQSAMIDDPVVKNVLMESQSRINVMENIYNDLYKRKDFNVVFIKKYITDLVLNIKYLYKSLSNAEIEFNIDDLAIERKISFPLGMIVNELVTNAFKYAFMNDRENKDNKINISINKKNHEYLVINISDNGRGFPESVLNNKSEGFGMQLLNLLSKQLNGSLNLTNQNGAFCEFIMKIK